MALAIAVLAGSAAQGSETRRGLVVAPEHRYAPCDRDDSPYSQSVETRIVSGRAWAAGCTARTRAPLRQPSGGGHRTYGTSNIWWPPRRRMTAGSALRTQPRSAPVRVRSPESHAGGASGEQAPEERKGRRRGDATDEPLLVRRQGRGGEAEVQADGRCTGGSDPGECPVGVRLDGDGRGRGARGDGSADTERRNAKHRRRATPVGHERKRTNYMPQGPRARHRAGGAGASSIPIHAGRRWGRSGLRMSAALMRARKNTTCRS